MPRDPVTGVFTRVNNSFSEPVQGTVIDPTDAIALFNDYDDGLNEALPIEPTQVTTSTATIAAGDGSVAVVRVAPTATGLTLPTVSARNGTPLSIFDWSSGIAADHTITLTPAGTEKIMNLSSYSIVSTTAQLAGLTLHPSTTLNGWFIA